MVVEHVHNGLRHRRADGPDPAPGQRSRGSVTAELAVALPAVTALLALLMLGAGVGIQQLRLEEAAAAGARGLARGDATSLVQNTIGNIAGSGSSASIGVADGYATVTVSGRVTGPLSALVAWSQHATASARLETLKGTGQLPAERPAAGPDTAGPRSAEIGPRAGPPGRHMTGRQDSKAGGPIRTGGGDAPWVPA
ncbi:TadE family type IV pilus minor pilin [Specibacter cremeus]|uniref:TadE family type IV pilus minor pilin n=1 Tax=Specibacter cremeus TaxID=1629051 RepID=UPI00197C410D|nr:TadE family type IV pilus minor pilin [Specibacter cremeus]